MKLRHHVTGAIARGEAAPIVGVSPLDDAIAMLEANGAERVTITEMHARAFALGYVFPDHMSCASMSRMVTGHYAGLSYPSLTLYPVQHDNGVSAYNVGARRDERFDKLQALRDQAFAVSRGRIVSF